jgi:hypothetical protein
LLQCSKAVNVVRCLPARCPVLARNSKVRFGRNSWDLSIDIACAKAWWDWRWQMRRRSFGRELELETVRLERGVSVAQGRVWRARRAGRATSSEDQISMRPSR